MRKWLAVLIILGLMAGGMPGCTKKAAQTPVEPSTQVAVAVTNMPARGFVKGSAPQGVANLEITPATQFVPGSTIEVTLKNAKWNHNQPSAEQNKGWQYKGLSNSDLTVSYTQSGEAGLDKLLLVLPGVLIDPAATPGDLLVSLAGTTGASGEYKVGAIVDGFMVTADQPVVKVSALEQSAGKITLSEAVEYGFSGSAQDGVLKMALPSGINLSVKPRVFLDGKEVVNIKVAAGGKGQNYIQWEDNAITAGFADNRLEKIEITDIFYDIDSRFTPKNITVTFSGQVLTGPGGSLDPIIKVVNADARSLTSGSSTFKVGSTSAIINSRTVTMDAAPYQSENRVFIPLRYVANALGIGDNSIIWDQANQSVTLMKSSNVVQVKVGSRDMTINGVAVTMDAAPQLAGTRVMLPASWIAQAFGARVKWDESSQTAVLEY